MQASHEVAPVVDVIEWVALRRLALIRGEGAPTEPMGSQASEGQVLLMTEIAPDLEVAGDRAHNVRLPSQILIRKCWQVGDKLMRAAPLALPIVHSWEVVVQLNQVFHKLLNLYSRGSAHES